MREIKSPQPYTPDGRTPSVFLAGSIEQGLADDWQAKVKQAFANVDVVLLNPRRDAWDATWEQSISNPMFAEQVNWELDHLERKLPTSSDIVFFYIDPKTKSPITLAELGAVFRSNWVVVCCPQGFWRRGNVEIMCSRGGITLYDDLSEALTGLRLMVEVFRGNMSY